MILSKFKDFKSQVVFSAEGFCWPDKSLAVSLLDMPTSILHSSYVPYHNHNPVQPLEQVPSCWTWKAILEFGR